MVTDPVAPFQPCHFGLPDKRLYGVYHLPGGSERRRSAVVLCPAWGEESMRAHRAYTVLATLLSRSGFPVIRFDYHGTGDSSGGDLDGHLEQWVEDVATASEEVRGRSSMDRVCLVGLRLGASVALLASHRHPEASAIVLWDPVVSGSEYLRELEEAYRRWLRGSFAADKSRKVPCDAVRLEVMGFPISNRLHAGLEGLNLERLGRLPGRVLLCRSEDSAADTTLARLDELLGEPDRGARLGRMQTERVWVKDQDALDQPIVPYETLQRIVSWISEEEN
jgi:pimeloyl-ACP methyl ester carboxylesterase